VTTWTHQVCRDAALLAYSSVSSSLRRPSILARNAMDAAVAGQHFIVNDMTMIDAAPAIIDQWADESAQSVGGHW
jgi:indole-3-acetate monooxygenase